LSGIGGSAPSIGAGILADCWTADERGKSLSFYYIFPLIGPAFGPIMGGFIVQYTTWHWMFYATSILSTIIQISGLFWLPETYGPTILLRRAIRIRLTTGNTSLHTRYEGRNHKTILLQALIRPFKLLATQPIIQILALFIAYVYGLMYLALSTFTTVWVDIYMERSDIAGLNYLSLALGFCLATQICAPINDYASTSPNSKYSANST
jgi:MFS family permease